MSPTTKDVLETFGTFKLERRGEVQMKVRIRFRLDFFGQVVTSLIQAAPRKQSFQYTRLVIFIKDKGLSLHSAPHFRHKHKSELWRLFSMSGELLTNLLLILDPLPKRFMKCLGPAR